MFANGETIDRRYRVEGRLAGGATGVIYRCMDVDLERPCCVKVLNEPLPSGAREQLRQEAAALATVRHEHVVSVYAFGDHVGRPFFAMEYVQGRDLAAVIAEHYEAHGAPVPLAQAIRLLRSLCDGLAAVHGAGIVHRDIKPANVILEARTGRLVLADFGAAVIARQWAGVIVGTPHYMPPEAFLGGSPTPSGDLYSVGCLAFELLTGRVPFDGKDVARIRLQHLRSPVPRISEHRPELAAYDSLFERLLAKDAAGRPQSAAMLGNQLEDRAPALAPSTPAGTLEPASEVVTASAEGLRILVVDDDPTFARMAARCAQIALTDTRISVSRAGTGAMAIANALKKRPDLIVLDYLLPDMTGLDVLSQIRAHEGHHAEVLVASGALGAKERWRFHILGVTEFVDKPIEFPTLTDLIHQIAVRRAWIVPAARPA